MEEEKEKGTLSSNPKQKKVKLKESTGDKNIIALVGFILTISVIFVIPGLVLSIISLSNKKNKNRKYSSFALPSIIIAGVIIIACAITFFFIFIYNSAEKINEYAYTEKDFYNIEYKYYGEIDFSSAVNGANCYSGQQIRKVQTKKYGEVTIEFSYCKLSDSIYLHVYN